MSAFVCLCSCLSVNVWESNPRILFSGKAELQRWQMQLTWCLQMRLERPDWVRRNHLAQQKGYRFVPPDELASPKCYFFPLPHTGARSQSLKKRSTMSVNNALAGHQNQETLCPTMEILACQRVINSQINPTSRRGGIIQEAGKELWTQHHSPSLMGERMFVESWPQKQE